MLANTLAPKLPKNYRIVIIDQSEFALHAPAIVHAVAVPGAFLSLSKEDGLQLEP